MLGRIAGFEEVSGEYNGMNYHNVNLYIEQLTKSNFTNGKAGGYKTFKVKVKYSVIETFMKAAKLQDLDYLCNLNVDANYDQYQNVKELIEVK